VPAFRLPGVLNLLRGRILPAAQQVTGFAVLLLASACVPVGAAQQVTLLLSEPGGIYREAAQALQKELERDAGRWRVRWRNVDAPASVAEDRDGPVVTLGVHALRHALAESGNAPLLAVLVPSLTFSQLLAEHPQAGRSRPIDALFLDQPFKRQLRLIHLALPRAHRVGALLGPATATQAGALLQAGHQAGLEVQVRVVRDDQDLFPALNDLLPEMDVLLLLPDPLVVSRESLQALFLQTYRERLPIVAYSSGLTQAGALLGLYATPEQLGHEAGQWLRDMSWGKGSKAVATTRFPQDYSVGVNRNVARSLELAVPEDDTLARQLGQGEQR
jgi:putative ABC transport system substrate-binding protein